MEMKVKGEAEIRWCRGDSIYGYPTASDLLVAAEKRLCEEEVFFCIKNDVRINNLPRLRKLLERLDEG